MEPLISIIVPVYNVEKYIDECLDSIINQTYPNLEIILADDESNDKSGAICDTYAEKYSNIKVIHKKNAGLGMARNSGLQCVTGKYVMFVDSDDYISNSYVMAHYSCMKSTDADICFGGFTSFSGKTYSEHPNILSGQVLEHQQIINTIIPLMCGRRRKIDQFQMSSCMVLYSVEIINDNAISFPSERQYISEDFIFNINYLKKSQKACFCSTIGYYYRYNPKSLTQTYLKDRFEKQKLMTAKISDITKDLNIYDLCEQRILNTFLTWTRACIKMEQTTWRREGFIVSLNEIKTIVKDSSVREALTMAEKGNERFLSELLNYLIYHRMALLLWIIMAVKNKVGD